MLGEFPLNWKFQLIISSTKMEIPISLNVSSITTLCPLMDLNCTFTAVQARARLFKTKSDGLTLSSCLSLRGCPSHSPQTPP